MEKIQIFVDGGNFHHLILKKMNFDESSFLFEEFANSLKGNRDISLGGEQDYH